MHRFLLIILSPGGRGIGGGGARSRQSSIAVEEKNSSGRLLADIGYGNARFGEQ
jgi:hypothetical protein